MAGMLARRTGGPLSQNDLQRALKRKEREQMGNRPVYRRSEYRGQCRSQRLQLGYVVVRNQSTSGLQPLAVLVITRRMAKLQVIGSRRTPDLAGLVVHIWLVTIPRPRLETPPESIHRRLHTKEICFRGSSHSTPFLNVLMALRSWTALAGTVFEAPSVSERFTPEHAKQG